jgi:hypothetical protein
MTKKSIECHAQVLEQPGDETLLYKIIPSEYVFDTLQKGYLHFTRVDKYQDDKKDSDQPPADLEINQKITFQKFPDISLADSYRRHRETSYASCFSIIPPSQNHWIRYGGKNPGKAICIVFHFGNLRTFLNQKFIEAKVVTTNGQILHDFVPAGVVAESEEILSQTNIQLFHLNYGLVKYGNFKNDILFPNVRPNPIEYAFFKDEEYRPEKELRVLFSHNAAIGKAVLSNGEMFNFPESLQFEFNFDQALQVGAVANFELFNQGFADEFARNIGDKKLKFESV